MNDIPNGFIELHLTSGKPVLINVRMISFVIDGAKGCHMMVLGHNNGGFYVLESYGEVMKMIGERK